MIKARLIVKMANDSGRWKGHGVKEYKTLPRIGEHLELNVHEDDEDKDIGYLFKVVAVLHNGNGAGDPELYVIEDSKTIDFLKRLREES